MEPFGYDDLGRYIDIHDFVADEKDEDEEDLDE